MDVPTQIAVVDDDPGFLRALMRLLHAAGFQALGYASGQDFLEDLPRQGTSCAILDIHLGAMSGIEVARRIAMEGRSIPVVFMTAHDSPQTRKQAEQSGGAAYLTKPFTSGLLLSAIHTAITSGKSGGDSASALKSESKT